MYQNLVAWDPPEEWILVSLQVTIILATYHHHEEICLESKRQSNTPRHRHKRLEQQWQSVPLRKPSNRTLLCQLRKGNHNHERAATPGNELECRNGENNAMGNQLHAVVARKK
jgi:hypothetical protein